MNIQMQTVLCLESTTKRILSILKFQMNFKLENKHEGNFFSTYENFMLETSWKSFSQPIVK